jgi:ribonuclease HII
MLRNYSHQHIEIGCDEVGRGPLFGRVYAASVILPNTFDISEIKDSKKFCSKKKIKKVSDYIKENALAWSIQYEDENKIDEINILQSTQLAIHKSIQETIQIYISNNNNNNDNNNAFHILVDGNYFKPFLFLNQNNNQNQIIEITNSCIIGGDNMYASIAAASILAKVARDEYILELCEQYPELSNHYFIHKNKGYGTKQHIQGIQQYGITPWHRKTFGICKQYA